jgi:hypothetical protein
VAASAASSLRVPGVITVVAAAAATAAVHFAFLPGTAPIAYGAFSSIVGAFRNSQNGCEFSTVYFNKGEARADWARWGLKGTAVENCR